jgi:hypothetical protein
LINSIHNLIAAKEKLEIINGVALPSFGFFVGALAACGGEMGLH